MEKPENDTLKKEIRTLMRRRQAEFLACAGADRAESESLWKKLESQPQFRQSHCILIYMAMPGEPLTDEFISRWNGEKRFAIPLTICGDAAAGIDRSLELREYNPAFLRSGYKGILEPSEEAPLILPDEIDLAVIPGIAFARLEDGRYARLGHGGGYYDRLLPGLHCPLVGAGYSFRLVDFLPTEQWDMPLDTVLLG